MQLDPLITTFITARCVDLEGETAKSYRSKLRHLAQYFTCDAAEIGQVELDRWRSHLLNRKTHARGHPSNQVQGKLSRSTCKTVISAVRTFVRWCAEQGFMQQLTLKNIREPPPDPKAISQETFSRLVSSIPETGEAWEQARNLALLYMLRDTGGRVGAICAIDLEHIDLETGEIIAPDKGGVLNWMHINPPTIEAIQAWLIQRALLKPCCDRLFLTRDGLPCKRGLVEQVLQRLARAGQVSGRCNPHSFRHAFARDALRAGADLSQVAQMMNHRSGVAVTERYYARWTKRELSKIHARYSPGRKLPRLE